jgi:cellulose synthase/poly-beta-1,6-N-acetylglucosamine synthase-like glycosyltransferase
MTSDFPLVSVIIPVYNRDRYLAEAIEEAAKKALDTSLILETHEYLKSCETRQNLSGEYFLDSFCNSEVYQLL